jgi:hypothetical protein
MWWRSQEQTQKSGLCKSNLLALFELTFDDREVRKLGGE